MRNFFITSSVIIGFIILALATSGIAMALFGPFSPGNLLFPIQHFAEQQIEIIYRDPVSNSEYMLDLVGRRIMDLNARTGSKYELISLVYLDKSFDQATLAISLVPKENRDNFRLKLLSLAQQANNVQKQLKLAPIENATAYVTFQSKILALIQMLSTTTVSNEEHSLVPSIPLSNQASTNNNIAVLNSDSGLIPFPPGSPGAVHAFYPLAGKHASLQCKSCHDAGKYIGTPKTCILCHLSKQPIPHYNGDCALCHSSVSWIDIHFGHATADATVCSSCHDKDKPANHYNGQCSACHITQAWNVVTFDHAVAGAVDCIACHAKVEPAIHYAGQCSNCHNTSNWTSVVFDHTGFIDCVSCHTGDAPVDHYSGQCSNCHNADSSWANAHFNHSGFTDCIACHAGDTPGNHYPGQCSSCHDPDSSWKNAHFNHSGYTDCISCHAGNAPGNHYPGQCSNCHSTNSWSGAVFNHSGYTDCISCHLQDRPGEHESGQCSECHNTQGWGDGGDGGDLGLTTYAIFQSFNCSLCHSKNVLVLVTDIKQ